MAVGMLMAGEGVTREAYMAVTEAMFGSTEMRPEDTPQGCIVHTAGQGEQGWYIYDIWESKEDFERFMQEKLGPAMQQVMGDDMPGPGEGPQPVWFEIEVLVKP
jgi:hypothetical protein